MKEFHDFLDQYDLSYDSSKKDYTNFYIYTKAGREHPFHFTFEKDWHITLEQPVYYLRVMSRRMNYFPSEKEEQQFFQLACFFLKEWAETFLSYSYVFVDELLIYDSHLQTLYKREQRFDGLLMYSNPYQFCSSTPSTEVEKYIEVRSCIKDSIQREIKRDPRIFLEYTSNTMMMIYTPNTSTKIRFSFRELSLRIRVERTGKRDKILTIPLGEEDPSLSSTINNWLRQLYRENQLTYLFNGPKKALFHQVGFTKKIKNFSLSPLFHWLENHHTNEEIEKMAAIERRKKSDFFIKSTLLKDSYYLVPFQQYHFMFEKNGLLEVFTGLDEETALTHFYEKITTIFHENMKKEQQTIKTR